MDNTVSGPRRVSFESPPESAPAPERHDSQPARPSSPAGGAVIAGLRTIGAQADTPARAFSPRPVSPLTVDEMRLAVTSRPVSPEAAPATPRPAAWRIGNAPTSTGNASPHGSLPEPGSTASAVSNGHSPSHTDTPASMPKPPDEDTGHSPGSEASPSPSGNHAQTGGQEDWRAFLTRTGHSPGSEAPPSPSGSHAQTGGQEDWRAFLTRTGHVTEPDAATVPSGSHSTAHEGVRDSLPANPAGNVRVAFADIPLQAPKPVRPHATAHVLRDVLDRSPGVPAPVNPEPARAAARRNLLQALRNAIRRTFE
ncbi:MAG: hypothetical protein IOC39_17190 [Burkholderia sp.]|uniref:hypothetical protein n=1 Tax=Burkholderia sp. TaxID=36773 RepID=UPI00258D2603|nr:hypothetical protein [Burkholderia sp.]MCA3789779.1 hypothetical protein [Burkholderia sp.]MCA3801579.1 hypothetical protein [Burkholderia sp.]MCA3817560.1 hypothetical protein [Burkholderia sp.]MCA3822151.1 hypothetical protein [Burkholderia sp.]MCA3838024.1 hypothetical protein [Burkholderia sp.]